MEYLPVIIVVVLIVALAFFVVGIYNRLVTLRNRFKNAFSQIDVQLKRRYDLIPNLVETAKGYLQHERETLEAVIQARNTASQANEKAAAHPEDPSAIQGLMGAEGALTGALGKLFALSEAYPDLKANQNMAQLTEELTSTENKIAFARLHRRGHAVQHRAREIPQQRNRGAVQLQGSSALRNREGGRTGHRFGQ